MAEGMVLQTPQECFDSACRVTFGCLREPDELTTVEWQLVLNNIAYNLHPATAKEALVLIALIFQCPVPRNQVEQIAVHQMAQVLLEREDL